MGNAAFEVAGLLAAALERGVVQTETAAALHQLCGRAGLVGSLAVPLDAKQLLVSGNLLDGGPLCASAMPMCGTAAGSAALAAEPAVFDLDSTQRLQDLQLLNLRYHGTSFLCVPIMGSGQASGLAGSELSAAEVSADTPAADSKRGLSRAAATMGSAKAAAATPALGCLTLGFAHDVRRHLPGALVTATALAVQLAPLLPRASAAACARHAATQSSGDGSNAGDSASGAATQLWCQESGPPASELQQPQAHIALDRGFSAGDSATAAEVAALLRDGDSWLYDSSCGSTAGEADAPSTAAAAKADAAPAEDAPQLSPFHAVVAARRAASGNAGAATPGQSRQQPASTAKTRRLSREDSRRLVDQALDDLVAAELVAAADTLRSPAFGVSHTGSDPRTTATSSLISMPSLQTDSVDSLFSQPSFGGGGAFAITLGGGGGCGSPMKEWPLTSRLAVALPAASPPASSAGTPHRAKAGGSLPKPGRGPASLASSPQHPPPLPSTPQAAGVRGSSRSRLHATAADVNSSHGDATEAALEAEIWAAERPAMAAAAAGKRAIAVGAPPAAGAAGPQAEGAAVTAPQGWLERAGLRYDDAGVEAQYVRWHGLQAQKLDRTALAILLVMWVALGLPPMGLFWHATPGWAMWALGALWTLAFAAQQACLNRYLRHRESVLQLVHFLSLTFGCLNTRFCAQVAAHKLASAGGPLQLAAALSWLHRAMLVEAMAVFPLLLWVRVRRALPLQLALLCCVLTTLPGTCARCFAAGLAAKLCQTAGAVLLAVSGTAAPMAFMWHTERHSRRTFAWRLRGKGCAAEPCASGSGKASGSGGALAAER